jgi:hypothetical protein
MASAVAASLGQLPCIDNVPLRVDCFEPPLRCQLTLLLRPWLVGDA